MEFHSFTLCCRGRLVTFDRPAVLGILNVTTDSFYDGGRYTTPEAIVAQARSLLSQGADIIDIGVVSSRPGAQLLSPEAEADKLVPVVTLLRKELPEETLLSVDTCFSLPAAKAVEAGADIVNDISGGQFDPQMFPTIAALQVPYILMHTRGTPDTMQSPENTRYDNIIADLALYFSEKLDSLLRLGVKDIILDPGFGFAKTVEQNYELLDRLDELVALFPASHAGGAIQQEHDFQTSRSLSIHHRRPASHRIRHPGPQRHRPRPRRPTPPRPHPLPHPHRHSDNV